MYWCSQAFLSRSDLKCKRNSSVSPRGLLTNSRKLKFPFLLLKLTFCEKAKLLVLFLWALRHQWGLDQRTEPWSLWKSSSGHTSKQEEEHEGNEKEQGGKHVRTQLFGFPRYCSIKFHVKLSLKFVADMCWQRSMKKPRQVGISGLKMPLFH